MTIALAAIGDVHLFWDEADRAWFDASDYDLLLFVGDLAGYVDAGLQVARSMAGLKKPALMVPGNHDAANLGHLAAETFQWPRLSRLLGRDKRRRCRALERALSPVTLGGYSVHDFVFRGQGLSVVVARPHSQGGSQFAFGDYLGETFGLHSMAESAERLCALVDQAGHESVVFLAHCGPSGLGASRGDIWGCDFRPDEGDFGDDDLAAAVGYARRVGKKPIAVVAGHMHHRLKGGGERTWQLSREETLYVNAARVPRRRRDDSRHHVRIELGDGQARCEARWVRPRSVGQG